MGIVYEQRLGVSVTRRNKVWLRGASQAKRVEEFHRIIEALSARRCVLLRWVALSGAGRSQLHTFAFRTRDRRECVVEQADLAASLARIEELAGYPAKG